jgi:hypothetical protein
LLTVSKSFMNVANSMLYTLTKMALYVRNGYCDVLSCSIIRDRAAILNEAITRIWFLFHLPYESGAVSTPVTKSLPCVYVCISNTWIEQWGSNLWSLNLLNSVERLGVQSANHEQCNTDHR